jgi:hypothetical protein
MMQPRPLSRRHLLGLGAAMPAVILAGGMLTPAAAVAAPGDLTRPEPGRRMPAPRYQPATEPLMFC